MRKHGGRLLQMLSVAVPDVISLREALVTYHVREFETPSRHTPFAAIAVSKYSNFSSHTPKKTCSNDMQLCCTHQSYLFVQPSLRLLIRFLPDLDLVCFFPLCHWLIHLSKGSKFHGECPGCGSSSRPVLGIFIYLPVFIWLVVWKCLEHVL